jgi:hypothetical protein
MRDEVLSGQEMSMRAVVKRVLRSFAIRTSSSSNKAGNAGRLPAEFAAELLENYRAQLLQRAQPPLEHDPEKWEPVFG